MSALLQVEGLRKTFRIGNRGVFQTQRVVTAVDDVSFDVESRRTFGLVGESGSGKTTIARLILRLIEPTAGKVLFDGRNILSYSREEMRKLRREMQIVFQEPFTTLNPRMSVGVNIADMLRFHGIGDAKTRAVAAQDILDVVGLSRNHFYGLPHEFSGGQCQRLGIARALVLRPKLIVLDEPVSALDVSIRAQILNLLQQLQNEFGLTYVFISHDLLVVRKFCDTMAVLYLGKVVEIGPSEIVSGEPLHPYTQALLRSIPFPDPKTTRARNLAGIEGELPSSFAMPKGCPFVTRCPQRMQVCEERKPELADMGGNRKVACFLHSKAEVKPPKVSGSGQFSGGAFKKDKNYAC